MREVYLAYSTDGLSIGFAVFAAKPVIYLSQSRSMQFSEINAVCYLRFFPSRRDFARTEFDQYFISP